MKVRGTIDIKEKWEQNIVTLRKKQRSEVLERNRILKIENTNLKGFLPATEFWQSKKLAIQNFFFNQIKVYARCLDSAESRSAEIVDVINSFVINAGEYEGLVEELFTHHLFPNFEDFLESLHNLLLSDLTKDTASSSRILTGN